MYNSNFEQIFFMGKAMLVGLDVVVHGIGLYALWKWWNDNNNNNNAGGLN